MTLHVLPDGAGGWVGHLVGEDELCPCRPAFDGVSYRGGLRMAHVHREPAGPAGPVETVTVPDTGSG
jgi:hypothetical protein